MSHYAYLTLGVQGRDWIWKRKGKEGRSMAMVPECEGLVTDKEADSQEGQQEKVEQ
jgi:hypothetical protein